jgi:hypothetical protein
MIFDHISVSGSGDGNFDITQGASNITVQYSIIGSGRPGWSGAMLIAYHPTKNISIHHNLFSSRANLHATVDRRTTVGERNPLVHSSNNLNTPNLMADIRNNIIWNWGRPQYPLCCGFGYGTALDYGGTANVINNFYQTSGTQAPNAVDFGHLNNNSRAYIVGNVSGNRGVNPNSLSNLAAPWPAATIATQDACAAAALVLAGAGPHPLDSIDRAYIEAVTLTDCLAMQNKAPMAKAGEDILLTLPLNSATLTGSGTDNEGKVVKYGWTLVSGPGSCTFSTPSAASTTISNLIAGIYIFSLTVTDKDGATGVDHVTVTVNAVKVQ